MSRILRYLAWACAAAGVFMAFAWPFVISADPASPVLRLLARGTVVVLLLALAASALLRARRAKGS